MPERIRLSRKKGARLPEGAVNIARPGKWGNPFAIGKPNGLGFGIVNDRKHAVQLFARWLYLDHDLVIYQRERHAWMLEHLEDLRGRDLACWCRPEQPCHGAILLVVANSSTFADRHDDTTAPAAGRVDARAVVRALIAINQEMRGGEK